MSNFVYARTETIMSIEDVSVAYPHPVTGEIVPVLKGVNATVQNITRPDTTQGQIVALVGPSGVGKTTLLKVMSGMAAPDTGCVFVGEDLHPVGCGEIGVVGQKYPLLVHRTVLGNLVFAGMQAGLTRKEAKEAAAGYLEEFNLTEHQDKFPSQLSGGQRQRVAIAQQLICSTTFIVFDEPFSGLDVVSERKARDLMVRISNRAEHNTVFVVTHNVTSAISIADTVWLMGRDFDEQNKPIPGSRIMRTIDLMELGICWRANPLETTAAAGVIRDIKQQMERL